MKKRVFSSIFTILAILGATNLNAQWKPAGDRIKTQWAEQIDPNNVLPEYPRPQMTRSDWQNLNGLWDYTIIKQGTSEPASFDGKILVPFALESSLSGVQKKLDRDQEIWYQRTFDVPSNWKGKDLIIHFGAVDWKAEVYINDIFVGSHTGGYAPFSFNITSFLNTRGSQKLSVRVADPMRDGFQPRGKQTRRPSGIFYTSVSGIWQTVWIEPVSKTHIRYVKAIPNLDIKAWTLTVNAENTKPGDYAEIRIFDGNNEVATGKGVIGTDFNVYIQEPKLWSPDDPFLYDMKVSIVSSGKKMDEVGSYVAMRKISAKHDKYGHKRMFLNDKPLFQYGPLDQGWWPDGLYTAPTDEALLYDIKMTKEFGYNMIRKHVKVEPARWFYHCDREGILVWQDMPSTQYAGGWWQPSVYNGGTDATNLTEADKENFRKEWKEIMDLCMPFPSVVVWVPFNENWGQFNSIEIAAWTKTYDPSRLVNPSSGGNHCQAGDILDLHAYPGPEMPISDASRVNVLGEYGGIGYAIQGHLWDAEKGNWGYSGLKQSKEEVTDEYVKYAKDLEQFVKRGYSAAVYTQTTDVEGEVNGFITYDRKVIKMDRDRIRAANQSVIKSMVE